MGRKPKETPLELVKYYCKKCKKFLVEAMPNCEVWCRECGVWN